MLSNYIREHLKSDASNSEAELKTIEKETAHLRELENQLVAMEEKMLDITLDDSVIDQTLNEKQKLAIQVERSKKAIAVLQERAEKAATLEAESELVRAYKDAEKARDAVVKRLNGSGRKALQELAECLSELDKSNIQIKKVNKNLPDGAENLNTADGKLRGYEAHLTYNSQGLASSPSDLCEKTRLYSLDNPIDLVWPAPSRENTQQKPVEADVLIIAKAPLIYVQNSYGNQRRIEDSHQTHVPGPVARVAFSKNAAIPADSNEGKRFMDEVSLARATRKNFSSRFDQALEFVDLGDPVNFLEDGYEVETAKRSPPRQSSNRTVILG